MKSIERAGRPHRQDRRQSPQGRTRPGLRVRVSMMDIRIMGMAVPDRLVPMPMRMRSDHGLGVLVTMVLVMDMDVLVLESLVHVPMFMAFGKMQPQSQAHQSSRDRQRGTQRLAQKHDGDQRTYEGRHGEIGSRARRSQVTQREHEQHEAHANAEKAEDSRQSERLKRSSGLSLRGGEQNIHHPRHEAFDGGD